MPKLSFFKLGLMPQALFFFSINAFFNVKSFFFSKKIRFLVKKTRFLIENEFKKKDRSGGSKAVIPLDKEKIMV